MSSAHLAASKLFSVKGLVAVVTGGGSGIGLMATQALVENGAKTVYIVGRRAEYLATVAEKYGKNGQIVPMPGDVTKKEDVVRIAKEVGDREGGIHVLINNSGISGEVTKLDKLTTAQDFSDAHLKEQTYEGWDDVFRTNATSGFMVSMAFLPLLEKFTKGGDAAGKAIFKDYRTGIINITSISGLVKKSQNHFAYNASKAAANHLQRMLATEVGAKFGIRINSIAPGVFPSEMTGGGSDENNKTDLTGQFDPASLGVPADRAGTEEDMAGTILYLAARAGQYTDGVILPVDGGTLSTNPSSY
ncbi:SDR family NAD(P)-dependent oxidoreductase [Sporobolomyces salmoneus]|uniref:SDR family NAD(P)-dependent oxidoreductase n=1 Tax=Sporobolomyces salmoneus TaxID=183962 RepID=UPI003181096C